MLLIIIWHKQNSIKKNCCYLFSRTAHNRLIMIEDLKSHQSFHSTLNYNQFHDILLDRSVDFHCPMCTVPKMNKEKYDFLHYVSDISRMYSR